MLSISHNYINWCKLAPDHGKYLWRNLDNTLVYLYNRRDVCAKLFLSQLWFAFLYCKRLLRNKFQIKQYVAVIIWQGKPKRSVWFFPGQDFAIQTVSMETVAVVGCVFFVFES